MPVADAIASMRADIVSNSGPCFSERRNFNLMRYA